MAARSVPLAGVALALVLAVPHAADAGAHGGGADAQIRGLIAALGESGCRFQRNGRWYAADAARAHLQRKYDIARRRGMTGDAEAFIEQAASRSSVTGRAYRVACPGQPEQDAGDWLRDELSRRRGDRRQR